MNNETLQRQYQSNLVLTLLILVAVLAFSHIAADAQRNPGERPTKNKYGPLDVYFEDLHLMVDGKEFFAKGVSYNPFPLGVRSMNATGSDKDYGGGGFCSSKKTAFGEDKSACFGSDMFDGSIAPSDRWPPGPVGPWWKPIWRRDFAILKQLGVNTLRIYNLNPYTKYMLETRSNFPEADPENGAQHRPFLDFAHENGMKVILPIMTDKSMLLRGTDKFLMDSIESQIEELGDHPALLAYMVGNELDFRSKPDLLALVNRLMRKVRRYTMEYWNRIVPASTALIDKPSEFNWAIRELDVDFFTVNVFRSLGMQQLFEPDGDFMGWSQASKRYNLPLLLGEFGEHFQATLTSQVPDWFNQQWKTIVDHVDDGLIGAVFFEYCDEPYTKDADQVDMGIIRFEPSVDAVTNQSSLEPEVWVPDRVVQKDKIFEAVLRGLPGSSFAQYNMKADVWKLIGREPIQSNMYDSNERIYPRPSENDTPDHRDPRQPPRRNPFPASGVMSYHYERPILAGSFVLFLLLQFFLEV